MQTHYIYHIYSIKRRGRLFKTWPRIPGVYSTRRLFGARRFFIKCVFQYWKIFEPRTKIQQKRLKNVEQWIFFQAGKESIKP